MSPEQALAWARQFCSPPSCVDDLCRVALDRLDDIKQIVEFGEFSPRAVFGLRDIKEEHLQVWTAHELRHRRLSFYSVVREEEVGRKKKPDIRLHNADFGGGPVGIEIKLAENWTFRELLGGAQGSAGRTVLG